ncbi:hypothetical protein [Virgibacillus sp. Bac330]|uniref:hypothetical protein n=1 Tax=Virgibacillus sp. Bac330 TaxID=2419841 RepID=UPI000EF45F63|nr:hypothetical protein [Virgibacillus sp. Bac330]
MEHPEITQIRQYGYPKMNVYTNQYGIDAFGNEVFSGDEILVIEEAFFLVGELEDQTKEALELLGGRYDFAQ